MIDIQHIRLNREALVRRLSERGFLNGSTCIEEIYQLDCQKRSIQAELETLTSGLNQASQEIGGMIHESYPEDEILAKKQKMTHLKEEAKQLNNHLKNLQKKLFDRLCLLPNLPSEQTPVGKNMEYNEVVYTSPLPASDTLCNKQPHWELAQVYHLVDFALGSKITGAGFPVYTGAGAKLQRGLVHFFLDEATKAGYVEVQPPILVNQASAYGTGQFPDKEGQMYHVSKDDLYLISTAEISITNMYRDVVLLDKDLPIKHVGYTPCFRREAGSWGSDVRGLNRLHQFDKVELVQIAHPSLSYDHLEEMLTYVRGLVEQLGLPYRILKLCTGDLGFSAAMTYDIEVFSVGQQKWLEVSSVSNFETFQANRLGLRYKDEDKKNKPLHTLNGSGLALPRILAALLEYYQTANGIVIPEVLQPYIGCKKIAL